MAKFCGEVNPLIYVALDTMGGDYAPAEVVQGGLAAAAELDDLHLFLVGPQEVLAKQLSGKSYPHNRVEIVHAPTVITAEDPPVLAVRRKKDSSMMTAIRMVKDGKADAAVSAGNTGALMAGSLLTVGRLGSIERPALTIVAPTFNGDNIVLLDVGANMDAKAEHLYHYALMGSIYAREVLEKVIPRVGLLNVGTEENKGNEQARKAYEMLSACLPSFTGNVEARDIFDGVADVVVCDGFIGNILLKTVEGLTEGIFGALKDAFTANLKSKLASAMLIPELRALKKNLDYAEYGGAPLLGIDGIIIKSHGSSKARAVRSAIVMQAYRFARQNVNGLILKELTVTENGK